MHSAALNRTLAALLLSLLAGIAMAQKPAVSPEEHAARANAALKANQPQKAIPEFQALVDLDPANVDAQANLGVLLYFQGQYAPAAEHLGAAVALQPELAKIRALLGLSDVQLGHSEEAISNLTQALPQLEETTFRKQVGLKLVELDGAAQRLAEASQVAQSLRRSMPSDPEVLFACYRTATDLAGDSLLSLSLAAPASGQMQQAIAHELLRVRDISGAVSSLRRAVAANPNLPGIHFELAEALRASPLNTDRDQAEAEYRLALKSNPQDAQAQTRLADLLSDKSEWKEARALYESAAKLSRSSSDALIGLAQVDTQTGDDAAALQLLERAVANDPSNMLAHFRLSSLYRKLHRSDDARRELVTYQKLKDVKEKLREVYSTMKLQAPGANDQGQAGTEKPH